MSHTNDKVCLTVVIFLTRNDKVLLVHHPKYNAWLPVGGHIDPGEDTDEALFREIKEETGLETSDVKIFNDKPNIPSDYRSLLLTPAFVDRHHVTDRDHVAFVYFGAVTSRQEPTKSEEHTELRWFSAEELQSPESGFKTDIVWYALEALRRAKRQG